MLCVAYRIYIASNLRILFNKPVPEKPTITTKPSKQPVLRTVCNFCVSKKIEQQRVEVHEHRTNIDIFYIKLSCRLCKLALYLSTLLTICKLFQHIQFVNSSMCEPILICMPHIWFLYE